MTGDLFQDPAADAEREAEGDEYVSQGWRQTAVQARRDGLLEQADRYDAEADRWQAKARDALSQAGIQS